jgi:hypothetical protein
MVICLQIPTFCKGQRTALLLNVHRVCDIRLTEIHIAEPLVPDSSPYEVETAISKLIQYKLPGGDEFRQN